MQKRHIHKYSLLEIENLINILVKEHGEGVVQKISDGKYTLAPQSRNWHKEEGLIYTTLTNRGYSFDDVRISWGMEDIEVSDYVMQQIGDSPSLFKDHMLVNVCIVPGLYFEEKNRRLRNISAITKYMGLKPLNIFEAYLLRKKLAHDDIKGMDLQYISIIQEGYLDNVVFLSDINQKRHIRSTNKKIYLKESKDTGYAFRIN